MHLLPYKRCSVPVRLFPVLNQKLMRGRLSTSNKFSAARVGFAAISPLKRRRYRLRTGVSRHTEGQ